MFIRIFNKEIKLAFTLLILFFGPSGYCSMERGASISIKEVIDFGYDNDQISILQVENPEIITIDPQDKSNEYLLIRAGIQVPSYRPNKTTTYFQLSVKEESCVIENLAANDGISKNSDNKIVNEKINFLRKCVKFKVEDPQKQQIIYESNQENCKIEKITDYSIVLNGGDCFLKAQQNQVLNFEYYINPDCQNRDFLAENGISPLELLGNIQAFIYPKGNLGEVFTPTKNLWERKIIANLNSGKDILNTVIKEDYEGRFFVRPGNFLIPDVFVSSIKLENQIGMGAGVLDLGLLINTVDLKKNCNLGLCSSYGNYDTPFAPEIILYEINPKTGIKNELSGGNRIGDRFPGKWMGELLSTVYFPKVYFEKGKKYSIELISSNPYEDYIKLKNLYKSLIGNLDRLRIGNIRSEIGTLSTFGGISGLGTIGGLPSLGTGSGEMFGGIHSNFEGYIPRILESIKDPTFPPDYSEYCNKDLSKCTKTLPKELLKLIINFGVKDVQDSRVILEDDITIERLSDLYPKFITKLDLKNRPKITCKK